MKRFVSAAALAGLASLLAVGSAAAEDPPRPPVFDLGIYGGGSWTSTSPWFETTSVFGIGIDPIFGLQTTFWSSPTFGVRSHGAYMPGAGTVIGPDGIERHILPPSKDRAAGPSAGIAGAFKISESSPARPVDRIFFSYNYFQADDRRSARVEPNTDNVAFTLDRIFTFPDGNTTTGLFGGPRGMEARQQFDVEQHRFEGGAAIPIPAGPGTLIFMPGAVMQRSTQEFETSLSLITMPDIMMKSVQETEDRLWGPSIGGAFQLPIPLRRDDATPFPILFLTVGGDVTALFGDTKFKSHQTLACPVCGPGFPVRQFTAGKVDDTLVEAGAYVRAALAVTPRFNVFAEAGMDWTERGRFITPASPDQQPTRFVRDDVTDRYVRVGGAFGFGAAPPAPPPP